jgi:hypothetical protein
MVYQCKVMSNVMKNITLTKLTVIEEGEEQKGILDDALLDEVEYDSDKNGELCKSQEIFKER